MSNKYMNCITVAQYGSSGTGFCSDGNELQVPRRRTFLKQLNSC